MTAIILWGWAVYIAVTPAPAESPQQHTAYISAYSCDAHPNNPMYPCGLFRNGETPSDALHGSVAACPLEWLNQTIIVQGYGAVRCVDTPARGWVRGMPHIDLYMGFDDALQWGIQYIEVQQ